MDCLFHNVDPETSIAIDLDAGFLCYAATGWTPDDVLGTAGELDIKLTEEQATEFLEQQGKYIVDAMVGNGRTAIEVLLPDWLEDHS